MEPATFPSTSGDIQMHSNALETRPTKPSFPEQNMPMDVDTVPLGFHAQARDDPMEPDAPESPPTDPRLPDQDTPMDIDTGTLGLHAPVESLVNVPLVLPTPAIAPSAPAPLGPPASESSHAHTRAKLVPPSRLKQSPLSQQYRAQFRQRDDFVSSHPRNVLHFSFYQHAHVTAARAIVNANAYNAGFRRTKCGYPKPVFASKQLIPVAGYLIQHGGQELPGR